MENNVKTNINTNVDITPIVSELNRFLKIGKTIQMEWNRKGEEVKVLIADMKRYKF